MSEYLRQAPANRQDLDLLGIQVDDGMDRFEGQDVFGAEILNVRPSSPGARAGLQSRRAAINTVLQVVTMAGTVVFPAVAVAYVVVSEIGVGDWHDLIIGMDGERVHGVSDLESALEQVKEGDTFYLTVLRSGRRVGSRFAGDNG
jgi:S1-C subfamily serine protease